MVEEHKITYFPAFYSESKFQVSCRWKSDSEKKTVRQSTQSGGVYVSSFEQ